MKRVLLLASALLALSAHAELAPPCDGTTFEGASTCGAGSIVPTVAEAPPVPEAPTWSLLLAGVGALGVMMRRRTHSPLHQVIRKT